MANSGCYFHIHQSEQPLAINHSSVVPVLTSCRPAVEFSTSLLYPIALVFTVHVSPYVCVCRNEGEWNEAESSYCIYKFTHQIFTESDALFALRRHYVLQRMPEWELLLWTPFIYIFFPIPSPFLGLYMKIFHWEPYKGQVSFCFSNSSSIYLLIEKGTIGYNLIITKLSFSSY